MCASAFATANDQRQIKFANLCNEPQVVEWVLVNVYATPDAGVVCTNGDDAQAGFYTFKVFLPEVIGWGFANDNSLPGLLAIAP